MNQLEYIVERKGFHVKFLNSNIIGTINIFFCIHYNPQNFIDCNKNISIKVCFKLKFVKNLFSQY